MLFDPEVFREQFERESVSFALFAHQIGMSGAEDNIDEVGKFLNDLRQGAQNAFQFPCSAKEDQR